MLLTGNYPRTLDEKKRLTLPKRVRDQLGEIGALLLFVSPGEDRCLWLFTPDAFERLAMKMDEAPATDKEANVVRRLLFGGTEEVDLDSAGRILIPEWLVQQAGLKHELTLLGVRDHLEIWDAGRWHTYRAENEPRFDAVAERAFRK